MATINKRLVRLIIEWDKNDTANLKWHVETNGYVTDDSEDGGDKLLKARSGPNLLPRAEFSLMTGVDIQVVMNEASTAVLQAAGSGAGGHTVNDDLD